MDPAAKVSMEDIDEDLVKRSCDFIDRSVKAEKPFFLWHNSTRCHSFTHLSKKWDGKTGFGLFADAMAELDWVVGELLGKLDELGIADDTIVMFTSDNGAEIFSWPDGGNHPFRGEKGTVFEGGFRVPMLVRWPGVIKPGTIVNNVMAAEDWMPTLVAAAGGDPDLKAKLLTGYQAGAKTFKNHLDGYNFMPFFEGKVTESPRREFFYFSDNADLMAMRFDQWKITFKTIVGNLFSGKEESTNLPLVTNLRVDPWERYQTKIHVLWRMVGEGIVGHDASHGYRGSVPLHLQGLPAQPSLRIAQRGEGAAGIGGGKSQEPLIAGLVRQRCMVENERMADLRDRERHRHHRCAGARHHRRRHCGSFLQRSARDAGVAVRT